MKHKTITHMKYILAGVICGFILVFSIFNYTKAMEAMARAEAGKIMIEHLEMHINQKKIDSLIVKTIKETK